jgi:hypothetical protein
VFILKIIKAGMIYGFAAVLKSDSSGMLLVKQLDLRFEGVHFLCCQGQAVQEEWLSQEVWVYVV